MWRIGRQMFEAGRENLTGYDAPTEDDTRPLQKPDKFAPVVSKSNIQKLSSLFGLSN